MSTPSVQGPEGHPHLPKLHINNRLYVATAEVMTGAAIKALAGYGADYDLLLLKGDGSNKSQPIADDESVTLKDGMRFHVIEKNRNPGNTIHGDHLAAAAELRALGFKVDVRIEAGMVGFIIDDYPVLSSDYNAASTRLLLRFPADPNGASDMFWTAPTLKLASGGEPEAAGSMEQYFGEQWRRFSWHRNTAWKPGRDTPVTYLAFVDSRFARGH